MQACKVDVEAMAAQPRTTSVGAMRDVGGGIRGATALGRGGTVLGVVEDPHVQVRTNAPTGGPGR